MTLLKNLVSAPEKCNLGNVSYFLFSLYYLLIQILRTYEITVYAQIFIFEHTIYDIVSLRSVS